MSEIIQLDLFADKSRWPQKPYCSTEKNERKRIRPLAQALLQPYIQPNPPHLRVWSIYDIDDGVEYPGIAWEPAGLPPPTWSAVNRENGHAHLCYGLSAPVLVDSPDLRQAPLRYLCAVEAAFRAALHADQGYSGALTKNPVHDRWKVWWGPRSGYDLAELAEYVDLPKFIPRRKPEEVGLGRNVTLFDHLRLHAYRKIKQYKALGDYAGWRAHLNGQALARNGDFVAPLDGQEVWHIVKSVSKWTWQRFNIEKSDKKFSERQSARRGGEGYLMKRKDLESWLQNTR